jgi:hypothetical protein
MGNCENSWGDCSVKSIGIRIYDYSHPFCQKETKQLQNTDLQYIYKFLNLEIKENNHIKTFICKWLFRMDTNEKPYVNRFD